MTTKKLISFVYSLFLFVPLFSSTVDVYELNIILKVPRVYDNTQSLGYRRYQTQKLHGYLHIDYQDDYSRQFSISNLVNKTHRVNGKNVTYKTTVQDDMIIPRFNVLGNNRTQSFKKTSMSFFIVADPSYAIWQYPQEDNSLYAFLSGIGNVTKNGKSKRISGVVSGQLGCGCTAYGHNSPTRLMGFYGPILDMTDDVASVTGKWKAKLIQ